nr:ORF2 [Bovine astrovirus]WDD45013.1 ORF2 [Bovine astrovirus]WDD45022.1 ORF2 [Bovine astrovirus]WDD45025.1 ORF2 [Bovine astrovirus]
MSSWSIFGGADQRCLVIMPRNRNGRQNRNTTKVVVQSTSGNQQAAAVRPRRTRRPTVNVNVNTNRGNPIRGNNGAQPNMRMRPNRRFRRRQPNQGKHEIHQTITTTLGTVGSNTSGGVENEMTFIVNPATMKEQTGSTSFGPLTVLASQYAMWKVNKIQVTLKQLIGNNAASGTVGRVSFVPNTSASSVSWSSLGARPHTDVNIGRNGTFVITAKELRGPKDGWYYTNTNLDSCDSCAGLIQIHTFGQTMNPYQNSQYNGPLFLAEVTTEWTFKDYQQNPGMLNMVKSETAQNATIEVDENTKKILMKVSNSTRLGEYAANPSASEVIWMITDTIIRTGADVFPPPFSWLFKGGWWIVKRLANAPVGGETGVTYFEVYPSIADAQNGKPCYSNGTNFSPVTLERVDYQQVTPSNLGTPGETFVAARAAAPVTRMVVTKMETLYDTSNTYQPSNPTFIMKFSAPGIDKGIGVGDEGNRIFTWNLHRVQVEGNLPTTGPPVVFSDNDKVQVGYVAAVNSVAFQGTGPGGTSTPKNFYLANVLFVATQSRAFTFSDTFGPFVEGYYTFNRNNPQFTAGSNNNTSIRLKVDAGNVYVAQYLCVGGDRRSITLLGTVIKEQTDGWNNTPQVFAVPSSRGNVNVGLPVGYGAALVFDATTTAEVYYDARPAPDADDTDPEEPDFDDEEGTLYFDEPPVSVLQVEPEVQSTYEMLLASGCSPRQAKLAVNQIKPSKQYQDFVATYHDSIVDGMSPASARAAALGQL